MKNRSKNKSNSNKRKILIILFSIIIMIIGFAYKYHSLNESITYDQVIKNINNGEIKEIHASNNDSNRITVFFKNGKQTTSTISSLEDLSKIVSDNIKEGNEITFKIDNSFPFTTELFTCLICIITTLFLFKKLPLSNDNYSINPISSNVSFDDVAGIDSEKEQLEEIVKFLKSPKNYTSAGAKIPKGILLTGEPGTGKTLLAKAIAGEANVPFFQVTGSSFDEKFVGVGASRIRTLFKKAKKVSPSIIFIDELDSLAASRYNTNQHNEQSLNQLLSEMDGFTSNDNVIVIAATNHFEILDTAITRPGRFDRKVFLPLPDLLSREKILEVHSKNKSFDESISLDEIAKKTVGFSGADLENILNESAIYAVNHGRKYISKEDINEAIARVLIGLEKKNSIISEKDRYLTAVHESGHAIISEILRPDVKNFGISITPRGAAGGYNFFNESDKFYNTRQDLENLIKVSYGGRAAEELILKDISTGARSDLEKASKIAYDLINVYGMNSILVKIKDHKSYNETMENLRLDQIENLCTKCYEETKKLLESNILVLEKLSKLLLEKESLSQEEISAFMQDNLK